MSDSNAVLIVDPVSSRASKLSKELRGTFEVTVISDSSAVEGQFQSIKPMAVVASFVQKGGHGAQLCKSLRKLPGGAECMMVVHGQTSGPQGRDKRKDIETRFKLTEFIPNELDGRTLKLLLVSEYTARKKKRIQAKAKADAERRAKEEAEAKAKAKALAQEEKAKAKAAKAEEGESSGLKALLNKEIHIVPKPKEATGPMTFKKLLTSDLNAKNLKAFLNRNDNESSSAPSSR